jgi:hypothetical protein
VVMGPYVIFVSLRSSQRESKNPASRAYSGVFAFPL